MNIIETQNLKIFYRKAGDGDIPIIFLHGNYASSRWWLPQFERLQTNVQAYAPDLRGCGSPQGITYHRNQGERPLSINDLTNDLVEFLDALQLKDPILVGHSLGGVIAIEYALMEPGNPRGLLLEDPGPPNGLPGGLLAESVLFPLEFGSELLMQNALRLAGIPRRGMYAKALVQDALVSSPGQYLSFSRAVSRWHVEAKLSTLVMPITLVWGKRDRIMPPSIGKQYLRWIPQAEMLLVPDAGHTPHLERPNAFADVVRQFVNKCIYDSDHGYDQIPQKRLIDKITRWLNSSNINR